jgi:hypothetical protein
MEYANMEKSTKRAERRHHVERLKHNRRFHWGQDLSLRPKAWAQAVDTPTPCSCYACGNARRWWGEETIQERRFKQSLE